MPELDDPEIYRSVLEHLGTGVYIVDRNRRVRFWNAGAEQITGFLRRDVVGRFLREHLLAVGDASKDLDSDPDDPVNLAIRDGAVGKVEIEVLLPEGAPPYGNFYYQAISAFAPNPNAAKLWMEYLYSDEGQLGFLKGYAHPIRFDRDFRLGRGCAQGIGHQG